MKQKTALLRAIVHHPKILILDEPTAGLDITSARNVRKWLRIWEKKGHSSLFNSPVIRGTENLQ